MPVQALNDVVQLADVPETDLKLWSNREPVLAPSEKTCSDAMLGPVAVLC